MNKKNLEIKFYHKAFCRNSRKTNSNNWFSLKRTGRFSREIYTVRALISKSVEKQKPPPSYKKQCMNFGRLAFTVNSLEEGQGLSWILPTNQSMHSSLVGTQPPTLLHKLRSKNASRKH